MTLKHYRFMVPVLALVAAAIAVPSASARPIGPNSAGPNPDELGLIAASHQASQATQAPAVRPNPDQVGSGPRSLSAQQFAALTRPQTRVVQVESNPGFDWGDAGIGAGAMFALTMIGVGTAVVLSARRQRTTAIG